MSIGYIINCVLVMITIGVIIYAIILNTSLQETKNKLQNKNDAYNSLQKEIEMLRNSENFRKQKEEEVNEKIDNLHNGTMSADDFLPKR